MQNLNYFILISIFSVLLLSCSKETDELNNSILEEHNEISRQITEAQNGLSSSQIDSLAFTIPEVDARGGKVEFIEETVYMTSGSWYGYQFSKATLEDYKIYLEISTSGGSAKAYVYSYDGGYDYVKQGYNGTDLSHDDLSYYDTHGYIGVYASTASSVTFTYLYERVEQEDEDDEVVIHFNDCNPSYGQAEATNFSFSANVEGSSSAYGEIVFYAPSGYYYPFDLTKNGSTLSHNRTLSQVGTYYYRYEITVNGETSISGWKKVIVAGNSSGGGNSDDYNESCMQTRHATCSYALDDNAFYATSYNQYLQGQCTWYAYGRVIELVEDGHFDSDVADAMEDAFWGTTNRHAKNWPSKLGGTWENTNYSVLPVSKRKQGMLAVWIFGNYGHVGFVEEISADGSEYRLSDFNRAENTNRKDEWYSFTGTEDKLGGVYPRFLDLSSL